MDIFAHSPWTNIAARKGNQALSTKYALEIRKSM